MAVFETVVTSCPRWVVGEASIGSRLKALDKPGMVGSKMTSMASPHKADIQTTLGVLLVPWLMFATLLVSFTSNDHKSLVLAWVLGICCGACFPDLLGRGSILEHCVFLLTFPPVYDDALALMPKQSPDTESFNEYGWGGSDDGGTSSPLSLRLPDRDRDLDHHQQPVPSRRQIIVGGEEFPAELSAVCSSRPSRTGPSAESRSDTERSAAESRSGTEGSADSSARDTSEAQAERRTGGDAGADQGVAQREPRAQAPGRR